MSDFESSGVAPWGKEIPVESFVDILRDIAMRARDGDSMEGSLGYELTEPGKVRLMASYRIGNSMGQGGLRLIRDEEIDAATVNRTLAEPLPGLESLWHMPTWPEGDFSGPWKVHLVRRRDGGGPGAVTLVKVDNPDIAHIVPDYCWPGGWRPWEAQETSNGALEVKGGK